MEAKTIKISDNIKHTYSTPCIICEESVELTSNEVEMILVGCKLNPKVCNKCKEAVMYIREKMYAELGIPEDIESSITKKPKNPCNNCFHKKWGDPECIECNSDNDYKYFSEV